MKPVTLKIPIDAARREWIERQLAIHKPVLLCLDGLVPPPKDIVIGVKAFLDYPQATDDDLPDNPRYVDIFAPTFRGGPSQGFTVDLARSLRTLVTRFRFAFNRPLTITCVPFATEDNDPGNGYSFKVGNAHFACDL